MQSEGNPISPLQRATSNLEYGSPSITASSLSWQTHPAFSPRSPEAVLRLSFPWQLSSLHLLWEEERWVPFVFSGHISIRWWPVSTLLHTLTSWSTHIFNPAHFLETQGSQRLQETHNWFSSLLPQGLYQTKEGSVPRENGKLHFWSSKTCLWTAVHCAEKEREIRHEEEEEGERREEAREERREGTDLKPRFIPWKSCPSFWEYVRPIFLQVMLDIFTEMIPIEDDRFGVVLFLLLFFMSVFSKI